MVSNGENNKLEQKKKEFEEERKAFEGRYKLKKVLDKDKYKMAQKHLEDKYRDLNKSKIWRTGRRH